VSAMIASVLSPSRRVPEAFESGWWAASCQLSSVPHCHLRSDENRPRFREQSRAILEPL
jgi:hypothetical protein